MFNAFIRNCKEKSSAKLQLMDCTIKMDTAETGINNHIATAKAKPKC